MKTSKNIQRIKGNILSQIKLFANDREVYSVICGRNIFLGNFYNISLISGNILVYFQKQVKYTTIPLPEKGCLRRRKDYALYEYKQMGRKIMMLGYFE